MTDVRVALVEARHMADHGNVLRSLTEAVLQILTNAAIAQAGRQARGARLRLSDMTRHLAETAARIAPATQGFEAAGQEA